MQAFSNPFVQKEAEAMAIHTYNSWSFELERDGTWSIFHNGTGYVKGNFATLQDAKDYLWIVIE